MAKPDIKQLIRQAIEKSPYKDEIVKVALFGSYLKGQAKSDSDIDLLIEFDPKATVGYFKLARIKREMEKHLNREIDLVTPEALSKYFRSEVLKQAVKVYEKR